MSKDIPQKKTVRIWRNSLIRALFVVMIFAVFTNYQDENLIREYSENPAFDAINKLLISTNEQRIGDSDSNKVTVFAFDNTYMEQHELFNDKQIATYGYTFPREEIAAFITKLDLHLQYLTQQDKRPVCPKAVFIDFNFKYTSNVNNGYSAGDKALIEALSQPHCYTILLPKNSPLHYIERAKKSYPALQQRFDEKKIILVSPYFHSDENGVVRRYEPIKEIDGTIYPAAAIALWQLLKTNKVDAQQAKQFIDNVKLKQSTQQLSSTGTAQEEKPLPNVNANWILIKNYKDSKSPKPNRCPQRSYWKNLTKYSLSCDFGHLFPETFDKTLLLLGATATQNSLYYPEGDHQKISQFWQDENMSGVDIHANILLTLLYLDHNNNELPSIKQLPLYASSLIIFSLFFLLDLLSVCFLQHWNKSNGTMTITVSLIINSIVLFLLSFYLLQEKQYWLNWMVTLIIFQLLEFLKIINKGPVILYDKLLKSLALLKKQ